MRRVLLVTWCTVAGRCNKQGHIESAQSWRKQVLIFAHSVMNHWLAAYSITRCKQDSMAECKMQGLHQAKQGLSPLTAS